MNYQKLIIVGNATNDAKRRICKYVKISYTSFCVGVSTGENTSTLFPVEYCGAHAWDIAEYIIKGRQVLVEGQVEVRENGRFVVEADHVILGVPANKTTGAQKNTARKR